MRRIAMLALCAVSAAPVLADEPVRIEKIDRDNGKFFNKPGATIDAMATDLAQCRAIADGAESQINAVNVLAGGLGGILGGMSAGGRLKRINQENCMLIRGWRLFALTDAEGKTWKALGEAGQQAELAKLVAAGTPARGLLLREWRNDYAEPVLWKKD
jgi:hypothetical protein